MHGGVDFKCVRRNAADKLTLHIDDGRLEHIMRDDVRPIMY
jgi:hypothetical protein